MGEVKPLYYFVTSPPTIASGALVVGGWVMDNQEVEEPSGVVRGYDPVNGALLWAWDIGREGQTGLPPEGGFYTRGTPNVWSLTSADDELGLVYVPTGNATPDYFGGHRTEVMDKYSRNIHIDPLHANQANVAKVTLRGEHSHMVFTVRYVSINDIIICSVSPGGGGT